MLELKPRSEARLWELLARPSRPSFLSLAVGQTGRGYGTTSYGRKPGWSLHQSKARRLNALNIPYSGRGGGMEGGPASLSRSTDAHTVGPVLIAFIYCVCLFLATLQI